MPLEKLPETRPVLLSGLHFLLPVVVLVWCLMIERLSPALGLLGFGDAGDHPAHPAPAAVMDAP